METRLSSGGYRGAGYSPTGDTLYIYSQRSDSVKLYRINTLNNIIIDSIAVPAEIWVTIDYSDLAISHDGSKVLTSNYWDNYFCLFDFNTQTCQFIPENMLLHNPPIYSSFDGHYGICATMTRVKLIDFETGQVYNTGQTGASTGIPMGVSPKNELLIAGNAGISVFSSTSNEAIYPINFKFITAITSDSTIVCGEPPEADVSFSADLSSDGTRIFTANILTKNLSVIDLNEPYADTLVSIMYMTGIKTVPGTDYAIVYGDDSGMSRIISQTDCSILKELITAQVNDVFVTSDGQTAYLVGYPGPGTARVTKIHIDGASSSVVDYVEVGGNHSSYFGSEFDIHTVSGMSPDGQLILVGYDHPQNGSMVNIVGTETMELLTSVNIPEHTIYDFAFTDDSKRALAVTGPWSRLGLIISLDMENSYLENVISIDFGSFSADYNHADGLFYILEYTGYVHKMNPMTTEIVESYPTYMDEDLRIEIDKHGLTMVLTTTSMIYDRESYVMPGVSSHLIYNEEYDLFLSAIPGPDIICVFDPKMVGIQQFWPGKTTDISIFPNPSSEKIIIKSASEIRRVKVCNMEGKVVFSGDFDGRTIEISTGNLTPGIYVIDVTTKEGNYSRKMVRN
jgi:WD40 repeat protein